MALSAIRCLGLDVEVIWFNKISNPHIFSFSFFFSFSDTLNRFVFERATKRRIYKNQSTSHGANTRRWWFHIDRVTCNCHLFGWKIFSWRSFIASKRYKTTSSHQWTIAVWWQFPLSTDQNYSSKKIQLQFIKNVCVMILVCEYFGFSIQQSFWKLLPFRMSIVKICSRHSICSIHFWKGTIMWLEVKSQHWPMLLFSFPSQMLS